MIKLILISHGSLAAGMREAAEMILGEQEQLEVLGVFPGDTMEFFSEKLEKAIAIFGDPSSTLILSDLPCGTPANVAMIMSLKNHIHTISGCNLPMLIEVLSMRTEVEIEELVETACTAAKAGIVSSDEIIAERQQ
jgi:mannose PTS system EIIA component